MVKKEQQSLKGKWEKVIYLTTQKNYNKYTTETNITINDEIETKSKEYNITDNMSISEKWSYYIYKKSKY
jgi:hypothetical protein